MKGRFYTNIDTLSTTTPFLNRISEEENITEEMLYPFVDIYNNTLITDVVLNIFGQISMTKSEIWNDFDTNTNEEDGKRRRSRLQREIQRILKLDKNIR